MELTSSFVFGAEQDDGRRNVKEKHVASDGQVIEYEYLAGDEIDPNIVLEARAKVVLERLMRREASLRLVVGTEVPITKFQFMERMTQAERIAIRNRAKTDPHADDFMQMLNASGGVFLTLAQPGLSYFASLGDITHERAVKIGTE